MSHAILKASSEEFLKSSININTFDGVYCANFNKDISGTFAVDYLMFENSVESVLETNNVLYNIRDLEPYNDRFLPIGPVSLVEGNFS